MPKVGIVMGSDSDLKVMSKAATVIATGLMVQEALKAQKELSKRSNKTRTRS